MKYILFIALFLTACSVTKKTDNTLKVVKTDSSVKKEEELDILTLLNNSVDTSKTRTTTTTVDTTVKIHGTRGTASADHNSVVNLKPGDTLKINDKSGNIGLTISNQNGLYNFNIRGKDTNVKIKQTKTTTETNNAKYQTTIISDTNSKKSVAADVKKSDLNAEQKLEKTTDYTKYAKWLTTVVIICCLAYGLYYFFYDKLASTVWGFIVTVFRKSKDDNKKV